MKYLTIYLGYPSRLDLPIAGPIRLKHAPHTTHHEEDMDRRAAMGGLHPVREAHRAREFRRAPAAAEGAAARARRQATEPQGGPPRVRHEEGWEQGPRRRPPGYLCGGRGQRARAQA